MTCYLHYLITNSKLASMNKLRLGTFIFLIFGLFACSGGQPENYDDLIFNEEGTDFRFIKWGMTEKEVQDIEGHPPSGELPGKTLPHKALDYGEITLLGHPATLVHSFKDGRYVRGDYLFKNAGARDFDLLKRSIEAVHGLPDEEMTLGNLNFATWRTDDSIMTLRHTPFKNAEKYSLGLSFVDPAHPEALDRQTIKSNWLAEFPDNDFKFRPGADFRAIKWGASLEDVVRAEGREPMRTYKNDEGDATVCEFGFAKWEGKAALVRYTFTDIGCQRADVYFYNTTRRDYDNLKNSLQKSIGKPNLEEYAFKGWLPEGYAVTLLYTEDADEEQPGISMFVLSDYD